MYYAHQPAAPGLQFGSFPPPAPPAAPAAIQFGSFPAPAGPPAPAPAYGGGGWGGYAPHPQQLPPRALPAPRVHRLEDVEAALRSGAMR